MTRLLPLLALLAAAAPAGAVEPWDCTAVHAREDYGTVPLEEMLPYPDEGPDFRIRTGTGPITDMGAGIVATETVDEYRFHGEEGLYFDHCASGQGFHVIRRAWDQSGERRLSPDPYALMRSAITSPETRTLEEVRALYGTFAGPISPRRVETCGCAAYYPDLRGDREPYRVSSVSY